jgi:hypothetical protein
VSEFGSSTAMVNRDSASRRDRTAIGTSIVLHVCALAAIATLPRAPFPLNDPDERTLLVTITRIEHRLPPPAVRPLPAAAVLAPPSQTPPPVRVTVAVAHAARPLIVATEQRYVPAQTVANAAQSNLSTPDRTVARTAPVSVAQPTPAPTPVPTAVPTPAPTPVAQRDDGVGNFSETYPASLDPAARSALLSGVSGSFVVRVTVDENGRALAVEFVRAPADPALRDELRSRLLAGHFIPAACNGLRCGGTVELRN